MRSRKQYHPGRPGKQLQLDLAIGDCSRRSMHNRSIEPVRPGVFSTAICSQGRQTRPLFDDHISHSRPRAACVEGDAPARSRPGDYGWRGTGGVRFPAGCSSFDSSRHGVGLRFCRAPARRRHAVSLQAGVAVLANARRTRGASSTHPVDEDLMTIELVDVADLVDLVERISPAAAK
jgi:hypothetical protein